MTTQPSYQELAQKVIELEKQIETLKAVPANSVNGTEVPGGDILYSLIQSLPLNIYAKSTTGQFIFANDCYCSSINKTPRDILKKTDHEIHPRELAEKYLADDQKVMDTKQTMSFEEKWKAIEGNSDTYVHVIKSPIFNTSKDSGKDRKVIGTLGIFWDITEKKVAEIALHKSEERHRNIIENINEGYFELNQEFQLIFFNTSFQDICGLKESTLKKKAFIDLIDKNCCEKLDQVLSSLEQSLEQVSVDKIQLKRKVQKEETRHKIHLELSLSPILDEHQGFTGVRGVARDITDKLRAEKEKHKLETQLHQSQKMESLGTLAGGIAHDFNNILFLITGYTELAQLDLQTGSPPTEKLEKIKEASTKATELVNRILTFARGNDSVREPLDLSATIGEAEQLLRAALPANIILKRDYSDQGPCIIEANNTELHQILMNLGLNAGQAIGNKNGIITFRLEQIFVDERSANIQPELSPGPHALITISDTGIGIKKRDIKRIFDPFFTTKKTGEGTGLGLSMVHGIVKKLNGAVTVYSEKGKGTTFHIYLPVSMLTNSVFQDSSQELLKGDGEHILLVDDDKTILEMVQEMLKDLKYNCTPAKNGLDAFTKFKDNPAKFNCILTDQTMPVMTGADLSRKILAEFPETKIILCTGFSHNLTRNDAAAIGIKHYINKPVLLSDLSTTLHKLFTET